MSEASTTSTPDEAPMPNVEIAVPEAQTDDEYAEVPDDMKVSPPNLNRFGLQEQKNQRWRMDVPHGTLPEQCLEQDFWQHVADHLRPGDEIIVMADDMAWKMTLHVINAGHNWANVAREAFYKYSTPEQMDPIESAYAVRYAGTTKKWQVLRKGRMLKEGLETESIARRAAAQHQEAVKR